MKPVRKKLKIIADEHIPFVKEYFSVYGDLILKPGRHIQAKDVSDADILLVRSITPVNQQLLAKSRVQFVGSVTAGADHLDTAWLDAAGIAWCVATGFNAPPVADYVISSIAALQKTGMLPIKPIKAAIVGVGNVGKRVAQHLQALAFDLTYCDPLRAQQEADFISTPLEDLSDVDFISLHVPLVKASEHATYHFIAKDFLQRQKPGCVLLNASRGAVIDSNALLQYGSHLHWCLDVWEHEPKINKTILARAALATPHIAGYSVQSKFRGIDRIYQLACKQNIIYPQEMKPITMLQQQLAFRGNRLHWQDIVLGVFNPIVTSEIMRRTLLPAKKRGHLFDLMRNQFNYRHEFSATTVIHTDMTAEEQAVLGKLGFIDHPSPPSIAG